MKLSPCYDGPPIISIEGRADDQTVPVARQRRRMAAMLAELDDGGWRAPSRCAEWSVQDVVAHLVGVNAFWQAAVTAGLAGSPTRILTGFDPAATPPLMVAPMRALSPAEVLDQFVASNEGFLATLDGLDDASWSTAAETPAGHVPIRLLAHHALWDSWIHERDVALPLGLTPPVESDELRSSLHYAAALGSRVGGHLGNVAHGNVRGRGEWAGLRVRGRDRRHRRRPSPACRERRALPARPSRRRRRGVESARAAPAVGAGRMAEAPRRSRSGLRRGSRAARHRLIREATMRRHASGRSLVHRSRQFAAVFVGVGIAYALGAEMSWHSFGAPVGLGLLPARGGDGRDAAPVPAPPLAGRPHGRAAGRGAGRHTTRTRVGGRGRLRPRELGRAVGRCTGRGRAARSERACRRRALRRRGRGVRPTRRGCDRRDRQADRRGRALADHARAVVGGRRRRRARDRDAGRAGVAAAPAARCAPGRDGRDLVADARRVGARVRDRDPADDRRPAGRRVGCVPSEADRCRGGGGALRGRGQLRDRGGVRRVCAPSTCRRRGNSR